MKKKVIEDLTANGWSLADDLFGRSRDPFTVHKSFSGKGGMPCKAMIIAAYMDDDKATRAIAWPEQNPLHKVTLDIGIETLEGFKSRLEEFALAIANTDWRPHPIASDYVSSG